MNTNENWDLTPRPVPAWMPEHIGAEETALFQAAPDLLAVLIEAIEHEGHSVSGPSDWRAAEDGEPAWVCKARRVIAEATKDRGRIELRV